jgi:hypothetical protein
MRPSEKQGLATPARPVRRIVMNQIFYLIGVVVVVLAVLSLVGIG